MDKQRRDAVGQRLELDRPIQQIRAGHSFVVDHRAIVIAAQHNRKITTNDHRRCDDTPERGPVVLVLIYALVAASGHGRM
jgi:hypothetical protein